jgi:hypothetical protein
MRNSPAGYKPAVPFRKIYGDIINGDDLGGALGADVGAVDSVSDYSPPPQKRRPTKPSKALTPRESASEKVVDLAAFRAKVTIHSSAVFEAKKWKRSRVKNSYLIARIPGYDPVESEYGVHYLKVLSRNPKKTSGDYSLYEHAGFFTWGALEAGGRLVRERKRYERVSGDRADAS